MSDTGNIANVYDFITINWRISFKLLIRGFSNTPCYKLNINGANNFNEYSEHAVIKFVLGINGEKDHSISYPNPQLNKVNSTDTRRHTRLDERWNDVKTLKQRHNNVFLTLCAGCFVERILDKNVGINIKKMAKYAKTTKHSAPEVFKSSLLLYLLFCNYQN